MNLIKLYHLELMYKIYHLELFSYINHNISIKNINCFFFLFLT